MKENLEAATDDQVAEISKFLVYHQLFDALRAKIMNHSEIKEKFNTVCSFALSLS